MNIQEYLAKEKVAFELHEHPPAYTAQEVAAEEHVSGYMLAKPVVVQTSKGFAMCILPATYKLDFKKARRALEAKKVKLADETDLAKLFPDVEVGAEPPFGNLYDLPTLVDSHLAEDEEIVFRAGDHRHAVRMRYADFARLAEPTVADLAAHA